MVGWVDGGGVQGWVGRGGGPGGGGGGSPGGSGVQWAGGWIGGGGGPGVCRGGGDLKVAEFPKLASIHGILLSLLI